MTTIGETRRPFNLSYRCRCRRPCRAGVRRLTAGHAQDDTGDEHRRDERDDRRRALRVRQRQGKGDELGPYLGGQVGWMLCVPSCCVEWSPFFARCCRRFCLLATRESGF